MHKLRELGATKSALQQMLKGLIYAGNTREEKELQNQMKLQRVKKMTIRTHISIITLNVNGLSAPTKRHMLAEWKQNPKTNKTHI